jgi:glycosyltransferase involved in cell wall biosynthesis
MDQAKKLKVLHLTTHLNIGGISRYILMTGSRFVRMGHEVSVLSSGGNLEEDFLKKKIRCHVFPIRTKCEFHPKLWFALGGIVRLVKEEKYDVLHAHTRVTQVLARMVSRLTGVPFVSTFHGFYKRRLGRRLFKCWGDRVIAVSPLVARDLERKHRIPKSRIRIIDNAVDIEDLETALQAQDRYSVRRLHGIRPEAKVIGCIARLVRDKGQDYLVRAVRELKKKFPDVFLIMIGDGRERKRLEKLIRKLRLDEQVLFMEGQPDVTAYLAMMDVFAQPATFREGFGLSMVEAMVAKIPVVATDIFATNTIIRDHVNGFLVPPKNVPALAAALGAVFAKPEMAASVASNGYDTATRLYSIDRMVSELETVYREVVR